MQMGTVDPLFDTLHRDAVQQVGVRVELELSNGIARELAGCNGVGLDAIGSLTFCAG